jgi:hypothetical protein
MRKKCSCCKEELDVKFFSTNLSKHDGYQGTCKKCKKKVQDDWYQRNKQAHIKNVGEYQRKLKNLIRKKKEMPCADCEQSYPYYVMDFDHRENKEFLIAGSVRIRGIKKILKEIEKCDVVCSNCHRERTYQRSKNVR